MAFAQSTRSQEEIENPGETRTKELLKIVCGIFNKLTPTNFNKLLERIQALNIGTEDQLEVVAKQLFEMAIKGPLYSSTYAKMCQALSTKEVSSSANPAETTNFRKLVLNLCQKGFEKDSGILVDFENIKREIESGGTVCCVLNLNREILAPTISISSVLSTASD